MPKRKAVGSITDSRGDVVLKRDVLRSKKCFTARDKERVVLAVENGIVSFEEVSTALRMSREEYDGFKKSYANGGVKALQLNRLPGKAAFETQPTL